MNIKKNHPVSFSKEEVIPYYLINSKLIDTIYTQKTTIFYLFVIRKFHVITVLTQTLPLLTALGISKTLNLCHHTKKTDATLSLHT